MKHFEGRIKVEELTQSLVDIYPKETPIFNNEYSAVEDEGNKSKIKNADKWIWCGTFSFIYMDKEKDNEFTNKQMMEHLTKKLKKIIQQSQNLKQKKTEEKNLVLKNKKKRKHLIRV